MLTFDAVKQILPLASGRNREWKQLLSQKSKIKGFEKRDNGSWRTIDCHGNEMGFDFTITVVRIHEKRRMHE